MQVLRLDPGHHPRPRSELSAADYRYLLDGSDIAVYRAACTATVPGLDTGKRAWTSCEVKGSSTSTLDCEVLPPARVTNSTALRADFAYERYEESCASMRAARALRLGEWL